MLVFLVTKPSQPFQSLSCFSASVIKLYSSAMQLVQAQIHSLLTPTHPLTPTLINYILLNSKIVTESSMTIKVRHLA